MGKDTKTPTPADGGMAVFERQVKAVGKLIDKGLIKHWGLSNENAYGITMFCLAADKLGIQRPVSCQNISASSSKCHPQSYLPPSGSPSMLQPSRFAMPRPPLVLTIQPLLPCVAAARRVRHVGGVLPLWCRRVARSTRSRAACSRAECPGWHQVWRRRKQGRPGASVDQEPHARDARPSRGMACRWRCSRPRMREARRGMV